MKLLFVYGENDYAAVAFEDDYYESVKDMWQKAWDSPRHEYYNADDGVVFDAYEFGEVDPKFIDFVRNEVMDYDDSKHANFYIVGETK